MLERRVKPPQPIPTREAMKRELVRLIITGLFCGLAAWMVRGHLAEVRDSYDGHHMEWIWMNNADNFAVSTLRAECYQSTPYIWEIEQGACVRRVGDRAVPAACASPPEKP